jgi:hypothetical protein
MSLSTLRVALVILVSVCVTLTLQGWVGSATIYSPSLQEKRELAHGSIIANTAPDPRGWHAVGMRGNAIRVGVPFTVEWLAKLTGRGILTLYRVLDTLMLPVLLVGLWLLLRDHAGDDGGLAVMLLVAVSLPLTYQLHFYQPWDRTSAVLWLGAIWLTRNKRGWLLAALLPLCVLVKYDIALVFALYWLAHVGRQHWRTVSLQAFAVAATGLGTYKLLRSWRPNSFEAGYHITERMNINVADLLSHPFIWPPFLFFGPLAVLAALGWRRSTQFERAGVIFAVGFVVLAVLTVNLQEVRALVPALLAMSASSARGFVRLFGASDREEQASVNRPAVMVDAREV